MFFATLRLLLVSVIFSVAFGGQWALDEKSSTSVLVGVGAATDKLATAAAGQMELVHLSSAGKISRFGRRKCFRQE